MKSWVIGILTISALGGLGWLGYSWAQRGSSPDISGPDWKNGPVNAEAVGLAEGRQDLRTTRAGTESAWGGQNSGGSASAGDRSTSDPFQKVRQTGAVENTGYETSSSTGGDNYGRYGGEPRRLQADSNAAPLAPDPTSRNRTGGADDIPTSNEVGLNNSQMAANDTAAETHRAGAQSPNALRYSEEGARQTSAVSPPAAAPDNTDDGHLYNQPTASSSRTGAGENYIGQGSAGTSNGTGFDRRSVATGQNNEPPASSALIRAIPNATGNTANLQQPDSSGYPATQPQPQDNMQNAMARNMASGSFPTRDAANNSMSARETAANSMYGNTATSNPFPASIPTTTPAVIDQAPSAVNVEGFGKPGEKKLEGAQTPCVTIEKIAPQEIQVGKPAKFQIIVRNTGPVTAESVEVTDPVPQGTQLISQPPKTSLTSRGEILWNVGELKPSEESKLEVDLMPIAEGEIGSVAKVQFRSSASVRTVATKPDLLMELNAAKQVMIGESVTVHLKLSNRGTGVASGVVLSSRVPPQFQHPAGSELEFEIGQLKPGDSRDIELVLRSVQAGATTVTLVAQGDAANLRAEQTMNIEVIAPGLKVELTGPGVRYLDKQAKYTVAVSNPGTAAARNLQLVTRLPQGMQFVEATESGHFDAATNSVMWGLDELPPRETGSVSLTVLAKEPGEQKLRSEVKAAGNLSETAEQVTMVEGVAAVSFTVVDVEDPVEVGGKVTYEIHVVNQGSKAASKLQVMAVLPQEIKPVSGEGPAKQGISGQQVIFEPLSRLAPKADVTYRVVGQCLAPGDCRIQVLLKTEEMEKPVTKEESTRVYKD